MVGLARPQKTFMMSISFSALAEKSSLASWLLVDKSVRQKSIQIIMPQNREENEFLRQGGGKNSWNGWKCQDTENICSSEFRSSHQELLSFIFSTQHQKSLRQKFRKLSGNFSRPPWFQWGQMSLRVAPEYSLRWRQVRREIKQKKGLEGKGRTQRDWGGGKGVSAILS